MKEHCENPLGKGVSVAVDARELASILAGLRFHQAENLQGNSEIADQAISEIASDCGRLKPLSFEEVGNLCQRLNLRGTAPAREEGFRHREGSPSTGASRGAHPAIQRIHDLLYLDLKGSLEFYNPDKAWDAETIAAITEIVAQYIPGPAQKEKGDEHGQSQ